MLKSLFLAHFYDADWSCLFTCSNLNFTHNSLQMHELNRHAENLISILPHVSMQASDAGICGYSVELLMRLVMMLKVVHMFTVPGMLMPCYVTLHPGTLSARFNMFRKQRKPHQVHVIIPVHIYTQGQGNQRP